MKIRLRWTNTLLRTLLLIGALVLIELTQGNVVHFVYQAY